MDPLAQADQEEGETDDEPVLETPTEADVSNENSLGDFSQTPVRDAVQDDEAQEEVTHSDESAPDTDPQHEEVEQGSQEQEADSFFFGDDNSTAPAQQEEVSVQIQEETSAV